MLAHAAQVRQMAAANDSLERTDELEGSDYDRLALVSQRRDIRANPSSPDYLRLISFCRVDPPSNSCVRCIRASNSLKTG